MAIRDLAGTGALQEALTTTNEHLEAVLAELRRTNDERLRDISEQMQMLNDRVDQLVVRLSPPA
jgi:hypothetical protein